MVKICEFLTALVILLLSYIFLELWNFSIIHIFFKKEILELGQNIAEEILEETQDLKEAKRRLHNLQSESSDVMKNEAIKCMLEYMEEAE
jgi:hypothetical protein